MLSRNIALALSILLLALMVAPVEASLVAFRRGFGGAASDVAQSIDVDGNGIYVVGTTDSFSVNAPNAYLTIFNSDDTHRCSVSIDLGGDDLGIAVKVHGNRVYMLGQTNFGPAPPNFFIAAFDTNCGLQSFMLYDLGGVEAVYDLAVEPSASPSLYVVGSQTGAGALIVKVNSTLNFIWGRIFKVRDAADEAFGVSLSGGRVYVTGKATPPGSSNIFLTVFDVNGNHVASRELATAADEQGYDIVVQGGEIYLVGSVDYPGRGLESVIAKFNSTLVLQWVKAYGTTSNERGYSVDAAGGLLYLTGETTALGSVDAMLVAVTLAGDISHSFVVVGNPSAVDRGLGIKASGSCILFTGERAGWPMFYVIGDMSANTLSVTISSLTPSITNAVATAISPPPSTASFSPSIDSSSPQDAFYTRYCPDTLIRETTTTRTTTALTTSTSVETLITTQTAYNIVTTTVSTTSFLTTTSTSYTTATSTITETLTYLTTRTEVTSRTDTQTTTKTVTREATTTQTQTSTSTVLFAEPFTTYILPALIALVAILIAASLILSRRRRRFIQY